MLFLFPQKTSNAGGKKLGSARKAMQQKRVHILMRGFVRQNFFFPWPYEELQISDNMLVSDCLM